MQPEEWANEDVAQSVNHHLRMVAEKILSSRAAIRSVLPPGITHDPGLEVLMTLFVARGNCMSRVAFDESLKAAGGSAIWVKALAQHDLVAASDDYVWLSANGLRIVQEGLELIMDAQMGLR